MCVCVLSLSSISNPASSNHPTLIFPPPSRRCFLKNPYFSFFSKLDCLCYRPIFCEGRNQEGEGKNRFKLGHFFRRCIFHSFEVMGENDTILFRFPVYVCVCVCNETTENPFPACTIVIGSFVNAKWRPTHDKRLKRKEKKTLYLWRASSIHKHTTILPHRSIYIYTINIYIYFRMFQRETHF